MSMKQQLKDHARSKNGNSHETQTIEDSQEVEEEKKRLLQLGNLVIIDYIRSSMDILLNLKVEEAMNDHKQDKKQYESYINSSRGGHGALSNDGADQSERSSAFSQVS